MKHHEAVIARLLMMTLLFTQACSFHIDLNGVAFTQQSVEKTINEKLPTQFHQIAPDLPLGHAECPNGIMELDHGKIGHCLFELGPMSIPIVVTMGATHQLQYKADGLFFDMNRLQQYVESTLRRSYGVEGRVDCGIPRYRIIKAGAQLSCSVVGAPHVKAVRLRALSGGDVFIFHPPGLQSAVEALTQPLIAEHKRGRVVVTSGRVIERILQASVVPLLEQQTAKLGIKIGPLVCPPTVDLSGDKRGMCRLDASGKPVQMAFWIKGTDWNAESVQMMFSRTTVERAATTYYQELEQNNGFSVKVRVRCPWPDVLVVTPPASRDCVMIVGKGRRRLTVQIPNRSGTFNYYVWPTTND